MAKKNYYEAFNNYRQNKNTKQWGSFSLNP